MKKKNFEQFLKDIIRTKQPVLINRIKSNPETGSGTGSKLKRWWW